jgi:mannose/fructose/N-acetylgalactosamine-specific phosphotransferase system component IIC
MPSPGSQGYHCCRRHPACIGFAMLLKILPVEKYPAFLLVGFVLFAY